MSSVVSRDSKSQTSAAIVNRRRLHSQLVVIASEHAAITTRIAKATAELRKAEKSLQTMKDGIVEMALIFERQEQEQESTLQSEKGVTRD